MVISLQTGEAVPLHKEPERGRKETHNVEEVKRGECDRSGKEKGTTSAVALAYEGHFTETEQLAGCRIREQMNKTARKTQNERLIS